MKQLFKVLLIICLGSSALFSQEVKDGSLSVLVFSNGKPLVSNEIKVDGKKVFRTDSDGALQTRLRPGSHQIEIFGKDAQGVNLGYFKKQVRIEKAKDTQVIATLSKTGADTIDIDVPVESAVQEDVKVEASTGTGTLNGRVLSSQGNKPIAGARVFVRGTSVDTRTDANGRFSATVPSGKSLSISVVHSAYSAQTVGGIKVKANGATSKTVKLTPASMELEEFVVLAPKVEGSITDIIQEEKNTNAVANILGAEEISKKGDGDAANALKRVTGITLVDGSSVFVRGLGERYSNIEMNGMPLPSPNPLKRSVPLDIFPTSVIGSMKVQKSASANIPSSFGGGYINIRTKDNIKEDYIKLSIGGKVNSNTGTEVLRYKGSDTDILGYDDGYRDIPQSILDLGIIKEGETITNFATLPNDQHLAMIKSVAQREYNAYFEALPIGLSGSIEGARQFKIEDEHSIDIFGTYGYSQDHDYREETFYSYDYDQRNNRLKTEATKFGTNYKTTSEYSHGGMLNINYLFSDVLKVKYTKLYTHSGESRTRLADGVFGSNEDTQKKYFLDWEERTLNVDQLIADFDYQAFNLDNTFTFGLEFAEAILKQPNNYKYTYLLERGEYFLTDNFNNNIMNRLNSEDELFSMFIQNKIDIEIFSNDDYIDVGLAINSKERSATQEKFYLRSTKTVDETLLTNDIDSIYSEYITNTDDLNFRVASLFSSSDYYDATLDENNFYINFFTKPYENLEFIVGIRYVDLIQSLYQYGLEDDDVRNPISQSESSLEVNDIFPSFNIKYRPNEEHQFDMAISKTYIMPDFREFTDGIYFHPFEVAEIKGNPELVNTTIYSFDLKYSYFISDSENIQAGAFYKYMDKPIEDTQVPSSSIDIYGFDNADYAHLMGVELSGRKTLDFLSTLMDHSWRQYLGSPNNYYLSGNFSYTHSIVSLREEQLDTFTTNERQLQGLSPFVINLTLGYDSEMRNVALSYNKMDERIRKVGLVDGQNIYPDYYEVPPHLLDFVWQEKFDNGLDVKLKLGNILDDKTVWKQGENITKEFKTGQTVSFGASYKF